MVDDLQQGPRSSRYPPRALSSRGTTAPPGRARVRLGSARGDATAGCEAWRDGRAGGARCGRSACRADRTGPTDGDAGGDERPPERELDACRFRDLPLRADACTIAAWNPTSWSWLALLPSPPRSRLFWRARRSSSRASEPERQRPSRKLEELRDLVLRHRTVLAAPSLLRSTSDLRGGSRREASERENDIEARFVLMNYESAAARNPIESVEDARPTRRQRSSTFATVAEHARVQRRLDEIEPADVRPTASSRPTATSISKKRVRERGRYARSPPRRRWVRECPDCGMRPAARAEGHLRRTAERVIVTSFGHLVLKVLRTCRTRAIPQPEVPGR